MGSQQEHNDENTSNGGGGMLATATGAASTAGTSIANAVSSTYNQAPDLGVTSTAQSVYEKAPDLGISRRLAGEQNNGQEDGTSDESNGGPTTAGGQEASHDGARIVQEAHERRLAETREKGPSTDKRLNKSQSEIGIEDGIPTAAGAGTTMGPDDKAQSALRSGAERHEAKVPQDYENVDCPTKHAGDKQGKHIVPVGSSSSSSGQQQQSQVGGEDQEEEQTEEHKRGLGQKLKSSIKGDAKIISGVLTKNQEKKELGHAIKKGET
ncbi:unnamed protein product [Sympodiomycopsis kandeliae]